MIDLPSLPQALRLASRRLLSVGHTRWRRPKVDPESRPRTMQALTNLPDIAQEPVAKRVLIDGMFDNPNYWARLELARRALGLRKVESHGITSLHTRPLVLRNFEALGINSTRCWDIEILKTWRGDAAARAAIRQIKRPEDVLDLQLPFGFPAAYVYDSILKRQKKAVVDPKDPQVVDFVFEAFRSLHTADRLLDEIKPDLLLMSHHISFSYGSLCWVALQRGIDVIILYSFYGKLRFFRARTPEDLWNYLDRPTKADMDEVDPALAAELEAAGRHYMETRLGGAIKDIGAVYAYSRQPRQGLNKQLVCDRFGWDPSLPIVAVYCGNWFDNIHGLGMSHFRDLYEWLTATLNVASTTRHCNWLIRGHPCDEWFGGIRLHELLPDIGTSHIVEAPGDWNAADVLEIADAVISYHSTASIEFAHLGKPALVADRGWYHDLGFVVWPKSREEYLAKLASPWWDEVDRDRVKHRAWLFAGWFYGAPEAQSLWLDDSGRDELYLHLASVTTNFLDRLDHETVKIQKWHASGARALNTYTVLQGAGSGTASS